MDKKILTFIGKDGFDCPTYRDQSGTLWKDINLGNSESPDLYSVTNNDPDGEPLYPIKGDFVFDKSGPYKKNPFEFEYMLLDRMRADCDYYLGYGGRSNYALNDRSVEEHIGRMKELWNKFPVNAKPEWLPWEQILEYEAAMGMDEEKRAEGCAALEKRGVFIFH